jgi:hypothetical protein
MTDQQQQLVKIAGMFENTSAAGNTYYVGVAAGMKFLLFKNREQAEGTPGWTLFITQREDKKQAPADPAQPAAEAKCPEHRSAKPRVKGPIDPPFDDPIGF